jgi:hypothetical protein
MPTECTSARELCQNNDGSYGEDCLQRFEENCRGQYSRVLRSEMLAIEKEK